MFGTASKNGDDWGMGQQISPCSPAWCFIFLENPSHGPNKARAPSAKLARVYRRWNPRPQRWDIKFWQQVAMENMVLCWSTGFRGLFLLLIDLLRCFCLAICCYSTSLYSLFFEIRLSISCRWCGGTPIQLCLNPSNMLAGAIQPHPSGRKPWHVMGKMRFKTFGWN